MPWTLDKLKTQPQNLDLPLRPSLPTTIPDRGSGWTMNAGRGAYEVRYYSKGGVGADGLATITSGSGTAVAVNCTCPATGGGNAYLLPWDTDHVYVTDLAQKYDLFFTPKLNGCGIFISGGSCNPTVVHANAEASIPAPQGFDAVSTQNLMNAYQAEYDAMALSLIGRGDLDAANLVKFRPGDHGYRGDAAVFGVRQASRWAFYAVIGSTRNPPVVKLWG